MSQEIMYVILGVLLIGGIYMMIKKYLKKKKQQDNFHTFVKPKIKEKLKQDGYANHTYEILHRYHHALTGQNRTGNVDLILKVINPKVGEKSAQNIGYKLSMNEVPVNKKEFVWEVEDIVQITVEEIEVKLKEKEDRKKHKIKYLKSDTKEKLVNTKKKMGQIKISNLKTSLFHTKKEKEDNNEDPIDPKELNVVEDPYDVI